MGKMLAAALLVLAASSARAQEQARSCGPRSGVTQAQTLVIRTAADWKTFAAAHADVKPMPDVDFSKDMIVGVFLGERRTAGTTVDLKVVGRIDGLLVLYSEKAPQSVFSADVIITPYALAAVPQRATVQFEREATARALDQARGLAAALRPDR